MKTILTFTSATVVLAWLSANTTRGFDPHVASSARNGAQSQAEARQVKVGAEVLLDKCVAELEAGNYEAAIEQSSKAIRENPGLAKAYRCRGVAFEMEGEFEKALADLDQAVNLDPTDVNNIFPRGCVKFYRGEYRSAIEDFNVVIGDVPTGAHVYRFRGRCRFKLGEPSEALEDFNEALRLDPQLAQVYSYRGELNAKKGEYERAIDDFTRAIALDAEDAWSLNARATLYLLKENLPKCIEDCNEAIRRDPKFSYAYQNRAVAAILMHDFKSAIADCDESIALDNSKRAQPFTNRAVAAMSMRDFPKAIHDLETSLVLNPKSKNANLMLAWLLATCPDSRYRNGRRSIVLAKRACELTDWKDPFVLDALSAAYAELSEFNKAIEFAQRALTITTNETEISEHRSDLQQRINVYRHRKPYRTNAQGWTSGQIGKMLRFEELQIVVPEK